MSVPRHLLGFSTGGVGAQLVRHISHHASARSAEFDSRVRAQLPRDGITRLVITIVDVLRTLCDVTASRPP